MELYIQFFAVCGILAAFFMLLACFLYNPRPFESRLPTEEEEKECAKSMGWLKKNLPVGTMVVYIYNELVVFEHKSNWCKPSIVFEYCNENGDILTKEMKFETVKAMYKAGQIEKKEG